MTIERGKAWWLFRIEAEPDTPIGAVGGIAKAIEARSGETERLDAKHESADPKGFAQGDQP